MVVVLAVVDFANKLRMMMMVVVVFGLQFGVGLWGKRESLRVFYGTSKEEEVLIHHFILAIR